VPPLLVATDAEIRRLGVDGRTPRPNVVVAGEERGWPGLAQGVGEVLIGVHSLHPRCIVTTIDPDTGARDLDVLRRIRNEFDGVLALNCWILTGGVMRPGDAVDVVAHPEGAAARAPAGGWVTGEPYPHVIRAGLT
jgi:uncharacterized protein